MASRGLLNWLLLVALLGLGWVTYQTLQEPAEQTVARITTLAPDTVKQLQLSRGEETLQFARRGEQWFMVQPHVVELKRGLAERLLAAFGLQSQQRYPVAGADLQKYGLDRPLVQLAAEGVELRFGRVNPLTSQRYVQVDGTIHMVAENDIAFLQQPWWRFAAMQLLPESSKIEGLTIEVLGELRRGDGGWEYVGDQPPASADQMQLLVDRWQRLQGVALKPLAEIDGGGVQVELKLASGEAYEFILAKQGDEWWLLSSSSGLAYRLADGETLLQWPSAVDVESE